MAKEWAKAFYKSKAWKKCRKAYFKDKKGICEKCDNAGKIVHHKIFLTPENINDPNISLNWDNLQLDCQVCHNREHHKKYNSTQDGLTFDDEGNLIQAPRVVSMDSL